MTFSENLMSLTDMKKIAAIMACLSAGLSNYTLAGVTSITGYPMYAGKPISVALQCSGTGKLVSECGIWLDRSVNLTLFDVTGICSGTGGYKAQIKRAVGGSPNGIWAGCGWTVDSTGKGDWSMEGVVNLVLTPKGVEQLPDSIRFRPYVEAGDDSGVTATFRGVLPDGQGVIDDLSKQYVNGYWFGQTYTVSKSAWTGAAGPVRVDLKYPDAIVLRGGETVTVLETNYPVFVQAQTDLQNVVIKNAHGMDVGGGKTLVLDKLFLSNNDKAIGVSNGVVRLDVSLV